MNHELDGTPPSDAITRIDSSGRYLFICPPLSQEEIEILTDAEIIKDDTDYVVEENNVAYGRHSVLLFRNDKEWQGPGSVTEEEIESFHGLVASILGQVRETPLDPDSSFLVRDRERHDF